MSRSVGSMSFYLRTCLVNITSINLPLYKLDWEDAATPAAYYWIMVQNKTRLIHRDREQDSPASLTIKNTIQSWNGHVNFTQKPSQVHICTTLKKCFVQSETIITTLILKAVLIRQKLWTPNLIHLGRFCLIIRRRSLVLWPYIKGKVLSALYLLYYNNMT